MACIGIGLILFFLGIMIPYYSICSLSLGPLESVSEDCSPTELPNYVETWWKHPTDRLSFLILLISDIVILLIPGSWFIYISERRFKPYPESSVN